MDDEKKIDAHPQRKEWSAVLTTTSYAEARTKADACKGKVKLRPNGKFEVRVGTDIRAEPVQNEPNEA